MRIGILLGPNGRGGMERQAFLLAQGLISRGIYTRIIFNSRPTKSHEGMEWGSIPCQYLWHFKPLLNINQRFLAWILKRHGIDILHVFFWGNMEFAVGAMKWAGDVTFIGSQRDTDFATVPEIRKRLTKACRAYDYLTCNCQETRKLLGELDVCPPQKVKVIYNGVIMPNNGSWQIEKNDNDPHRSRTILFPNRFFHYKNPILFIEACAEVIKNLHNVKIIFVGWGDQLDFMIDSCRKHGIMQNCSFLGSLLPEEIPYNQADLVVNCASSREGMSNSLMEALANGVPVVATKVGGISELIRDNKFGRIIPVNDKQALVNAMIAMLSLPETERKELKKKAHEYISQEFSVEKLVDEHVDLYNQVLSNRFL